MKNQLQKRAQKRIKKQNQKNKLSYFWLVMFNTILNSQKYVLVIFDNVVILVWVHIVSVGFVGILMKKIVSKKTVSVVVISI